VLASSLKDPFANLQTSRALRIFAPKSRNGASFPKTHHANIPKSLNTNPADRGSLKGGLVL
jgi:hypothetical protein